MLSPFRSLPPAPSAYFDPSSFERIVDRVFARSWQACPDHLPVLEPGVVQPWNMVPGSLDEPLLVTCDADGTHVLSNVCTQRGALLVRRAGTAKSLHNSHDDRRYDLQGTLVEAPGLDASAREPSDNLPVVASGQWGPLLFAALDPPAPLSELLSPTAPYLDGRSLHELTKLPELGRDYHVAAGWMHCLDEALRKPTAEHLGRALPLGWAWSSPTPHSHRLWLWPNTEIELDPWGTMIRLTLPLDAERTRIALRHFAWDEQLRPEDFAAQLDAREHARQGHVESIARGNRARLRTRGRYDARTDDAVRHFHRLLAAALDDDDETGRVPTPQ